MSLVHRRPSQGWPRPDGACSRCSSRALRAERLFYDKTELALLYGIWLLLVRKSQLVCLSCGLVLARQPPPPVCYVAIPILPPPPPSGVASVRETAR